MADAATVVKAPEESLKDFNKRLFVTCGEFPITNVQLAVVDGQPVVTLFSESVEADEEDVQEAEEAGEKIAVGDLIPAEDPVVVQVCTLRAASIDDAQKSQRRMDMLYKRADGNVTGVLHASGRGLVTLVDPVTKKETVMEREVHLAAVIFHPSDDADGAGPEAPADG